MLAALPPSLMGGSTVSQRGLVPCSPVPLDIGSQQLALAVTVDSEAEGPREGCPATGLASLNGGGRCKRITCGTP